MKPYVYRDPGRLRGPPVHVPEDVPEPPPAVVQPVQSAPTATPPKPCRPPAKREAQPLPPPIWGGSRGLELAAAESADLDYRTSLLAPTESDNEWVREYRRTRDIESRKP